MPKKVKFDDWKKGKEYFMWVKLKEMCEKLNLNGSNFVSFPDLGGYYFEPLFELIYKFGNILKKTGKLKEIKMDWIRPINYLGSQSDIDVIFDDVHYQVPKIASGLASIVRFDLQHLLDQIMVVDTLDDLNFQKEYKALHSDITKFFKDLYTFINS